MIPVAEPCIGKKEREYVLDCIESGWVSSSGKYILKFEKGFSEYCDTKYGISCSNGTTALHLALLALGIGKGDEVIVPTLTFIATANAVTYTGARPVFVDSDSITWNIDPRKIEEKITTKTKAIIPVHLYGNPCNMDEIMDIAGKYGLYVIEDAAEAHGAKYKGRMVGSIGNMGCFSFYGNKIITTGEGGMITTNEEESADKIAMLRDHAMSKDRKYWHDFIGYNYRMTNLQAALGLAQLENIDNIIEIKRKNARIYSFLLRDVKGITFPREESRDKNVYWMYSVLIEDDYGITRDALMKKLSTEGIDSRPFFYPIHIMPPYRDVGDFPVAEVLSKKGINLPSSAKLNRTEIEKICKVIQKNESFTG
ncbi:MAG: DegT/DnrJ/EryC1/StrS family aminotransferase [Candidatus Methanoperedens sp.]|nr:DegT/DnrJ/EryC1/StrS family aminotransferase [Candidatus Methanoperedens sp.]